MIFIPFRPKIRASELVIDGLRVEVLRKRVKSLRLTVRPPDGILRVSAPFRATDSLIRGFILEKSAWILRQRERLAQRGRPIEYQLIDGETHFFLGQPYPLALIPSLGKPCVLLADSRLELHASPAASLERRQRALGDWYKQQLALLIPPLLETWQQALGVSVLSWRIRKMKSRWGSCNTRSRAICLNLELAKRPPRTLEYIIVHELAHLLEAGHNQRFYSILDAHMPQWREYRKELRSKAPGWE